MPSQGAENHSSAPGHRERTQGESHTHSRLRAPRASSVQDILKDKTARQQSPQAEEDTHPTEDLKSADTSQTLKTVLSEYRGKSNGLHRQSLANVKKSCVQTSGRKRKRWGIDKPNEGESDPPSFAGEREQVQSERRLRVDGVSTLENMLKKHKDQQLENVLKKHTDKQQRPEHAHKERAVKGGTYKPSKKGEHVLSQNAKDQNEPQSFSSHAATLNENTDCKNSAEYCALERSPEAGMKLQLTRNAPKRRRYTEDDARRKRLKVLTGSGLTNNREHGSDSDDDNLPNDRINPLSPVSNPLDLSTRPSQPSDCRNKRGDRRWTATDVDTAAAPKSKAESDCEAEDDWDQGADLSSHWDPARSGRRGSYHGDAVIRVPETLGVDLTMKPTQRETALSPGDEYVYDLRKKGITALPSAGSESVSSARVREVSGGERSGEGRGQDTMTNETGQTESGQSSWPTDSVVFGSAGPKRTTVRKRESVSAGSLMIDEGRHSADRASSPVFPTHEPPQGDQSPALFDEPDSDRGREEEEEEGSPAVTVFRAAHNPEEQPEARRSLIQRVAVSPASPALLLLQVVQTTSSAADRSLPKSERGTSLRGAQGSKLKDSLTDRPLVTSERIDGKHPRLGERLSDQSDTNVTPQQNLTQNAAWTPAVRKKLFKSRGPASPSADETIDPCLLRMWTVRKAPPGKVVTGARGTAGSEDEEEEEDNDGKGDNCDMTLDPRFQRAHQTEGQDVTLRTPPSSSQVCTKPPPPSAVPVASVSATEDAQPVPGCSWMEEDSFDRVPQKKAQSSYAFAEVVRKQTERRKLKGFSCQDCQKYYQALGVSEGEGRRRMKECSRHRAKQAPPSTPEHFWSIGFPDTQECEERSKF
ncbi:hypothetical protein ACOMHN_022139 [Nucella lapillus]